MIIIVLLITTREGAVVVGDAHRGVLCPQGEKSCWLTVVASNLLPVHITVLDKADALYQKHGGNTLLGVCLSARLPAPLPALPVPRPFALAVGPAA